MRDALARLTAGAGFSFLALELVGTALQESTSRTLRSLIRRSTKSIPLCAALGLLAGALVQSSSAVVTILGGMAASGLVSLRQALPIVAFANVGTTALVFAGAIDIHLAVLLVVGASGIAFSVVHDFKWKAVASVILGVALLLYGSDLMSSAALEVQQEGWFSAFLKSWYGSVGIAFLLGTLASFLTQSTVAVALMTIALAGSGLLEGREAVGMIYGANLGSTLMRMLFSHTASGALRQISRFQDLFKLAGTTVFMTVLAIELTTGLPLVHTLISRTIPGIALQLAVANFLFNATMAIAAAAFAGPIERFLVRTCPPSTTEDLSIPKYAVPDAVDDPATAIDLLEKEQMRMLKATREYLALIKARRNTAATSEALHRSFTTLFREVEHFHVALVGKHIDSTTSERLGSVHARQKLVELVEDSLRQLAVSLETGWRGGTMEPLIENFVEALDFLLMFAWDAARTLDLDRAQFVFDLSSDRGEMMGSIRGLYLAPDQKLAGDDKALLLRLTTLFERIVWMVQRYAELLLKSEMKDQ